MKGISYSILLFLALVLLGCSDHADKPVKKTQNSDAVRELESSKVTDIPAQDGATPADITTVFNPFVVYKDKGYPNRYTPSGYMPNGECLKMEDAVTGMCIEGKTCIRVTYDVECSRKSRNWAGIYWLNPPDNWGDRKGGYNLTGARQLTFWARGEDGGERIEEFKLGGIGRAMEYPDTDSAYIGPVILTKEWKQYSIDLRGKDISYISGGFAWVTNADVNPTKCVFYLDNIVYE